MRYHHVSMAKFKCGWFTLWYYFTVSPLYLNNLLFAADHCSIFNLVLIQRPWECWLTGHVRSPVIHFNGASLISKFMLHIRSVGKMITLQYYDASKAALSKLTLAS